MNKTSRLLDEAMTKLFLANESIWKTPRDYGCGISLYPSEIHIIEQIGKNPSWNLTELALNMNVMLGTASKWIKKLEKKGVLKKFKYEDNKKEIYFKLTELGKAAFEGHNKFHEAKSSKISKEFDNYSQEQKEFILEFLDKYTKEIEKYKT